MRKISTWIIVLFGVLVLIWAIAAALHYNNPLPPSPEHNEICNYDSSDKTYVKQDPGCKINFLCVQGAEGFKDQCGCGCEITDNQTNNTKINQTTQPTANDTKNYCNAGSRQGNVCTALFLPVCGWFNSGIQCVKYPCAQTYSNSCKACHNTNVDYWTNGECPL